MIEIASPLEAMVAMSKREIIGELIALLCALDGETPSLKRTTSDPPSDFGAEGERRGGWAVGGGGAAGGGAAAGEAAATSSVALAGGAIRPRAMTIAAAPAPRTRRPADRRIFEPPLLTVGRNGSAASLWRSHGACSHQVLNPSRSSAVRTRAASKTASSFCGSMAMATLIPAQCDLPRWEASKKK